MHFIKHEKITMLDPFLALKILVKDFARNANNSRINKRLIMLIVLKKGFIHKFKFSYHLMSEVYV